MIAALLYLKIVSFANWVRWRARRLRQPKYLIGAVVGLAYFYFFFFRPMDATRRASMHRALPGFDPAGVMSTMNWMPLAYALGAAALFVIVAFLWVVPTGRAALGFSEAEIAFLFPAPVTRRTLVHFRLWSSQLRSLTGGILMALISHRWTFLGGNALTHALGWWVVFSTLHLHYTGAGFTLTRMGDLGLNVTVRRVLVLAGFAGLLAVTFWRIPAAARLPALGPAGSEARSFSEWAVGVAGTAPLSWFLYPLRLVVGPFLAPDTRSFLAAIGPAAAVIAIEYFWAAQAVVSFEDSSIEHARRRAVRVAAWRSGEHHLGRAPLRARPPAFRLADAGRPEIAFAWKNLLSTWRYFNGRVFLAVALLIAAASTWAHFHPAWAALSAATGFIALVAVGYLFIIGPQFARQDLRHDLAKLDVLKTYPLPGWQVVLGELLAPTAILTAVIWLALLVAALNLPARGDLAWLTTGWRLVGGVALTAVTPALVILQLVVPNAAAVLFPGWFTLRTRGGGIDVIGQRMIFFFAQLLAFVVLLVPALLGGAAVFAVGRLWTVLPVAAASGVTVVLAILIGELALTLAWLGRQFEKVDVSEEIRA